MLRNVFIIVFILIQFSAYSQDYNSDNRKSYPFWVNITTKGSILTSNATNGNFEDDQNVYFGYMNPGYNIGGQIGANWGGGFGFAFEGLFTQSSQKYEITQGVVKYEKTIHYRTFDKFILLRSIAEKGSYMEIGLKFTKVIKAWEKNTIDTPFGIYKSYFSSKQRFGIIFGFGVNIFFTPVYSLNLGSRVSYTISDIMDGEHYLIEDGVYQKNYNSYAMTNPALLEITLCMNFHIGDLEKKTDD